MAAGAERAARDVADGLQRLLQNSGAAGVPCAGKLRLREIPQFFVIRPHAIDAVATGATGKIQRVDAARRAHGRAAGQERGRSGRIDDGAQWCVWADVGGQDGGEWRSARVNRKAAIGLERVDEVTLVSAQGICLRDRDTAHDVEALLVQLAVAAHHRAAEDVAAASLRDVHKALRRDADHVFFRDEVDDAADRIGAIDGGRTVFQHFDTLDREQRDLVDIHHAAVQTVRGNPAAVQQDEGGGRALAAQIGRGCAIVAARLAGNDIGIRGQIVETVAVAAEQRNELLGAVDAFAAQILGGENLQGQSGIGNVLFDARTRDDDRL